MTGLTARALEKRMTFKQFALLIARQFGACITMRDDDMDAEIPAEFKPDDYHLRAKAKAEKRLAQLRAMTSTEIANELRALQREERAEAAAVRKEHAETNAYFQKLLMEVRDWQAPSPDHEGMKKMMVEQIEMSIESNDYADERVKQVEALTPERYLQEQIQEAEHDITYHAKGYAEEVERVAGRNRWLKQLRESLA